MVSKPKSGFVNLKITILNIYGYRIRTIETSCVLIKKHAMPVIEIRDTLVKAIFANSTLDGEVIPFFNMTSFSFNFSTPDIMTLQQDCSVNPKTIYIEVMQLDISDSLKSEYIVMNPGIYRNMGDNLVRRISDNPKLYTVALAVPKHRCNDETEFIEKFFELYARLYDDVPTVKPIKSKVFELDNDSGDTIADFINNLPDDSDDSDEKPEDGTITKISVMLPFMKPLKDLDINIEKILNDLKDTDSDYPKIIPINNPKARSYMENLLKMILNTDDEDDESDN